MRYKILIALLLISGTYSNAQFNGKKFAVGINAVYTTTAKIYLSPNSSDQIIRNSSFPLDDIVNPSVDVKYSLSEQIILGLGTEYMKKTKSGRNLTAFAGNQTLAIDVEDGFILIPLEFSVYYKLPFSTEKFKFLMGGGAGLYFGEHVRKFGDAEVSNKERKTAYGIHVMLTMDYLIKPFLSIRGEMKFRDPQFTVTSSYNKQNVNYNGRTITLAQDSFDSKINVDGVTFLAGVAIHF